MGNNKSTAISETVIKTAIDASLQFKVNRASVSNNSQTYNAIGNTNLDAGKSYQTQSVTVRMKYATTAEAVASFQSTVENELKEKIKQSAEAGGISV